LRELEASAADVIALSGTTIAHYWTDQNTNYTASAAALLNTISPGCHKLRDTPGESDH
jgi:hypothetical protein